MTKEPRFRIIGIDAWSDDPAFPPDARVTGICGSGIIEAIAEMRAAGLVDASGLIGSAEQTGTARMVAQGRTHAYRLHDDILVTQGDVRAIQLGEIRPLRRRPPADGRVPAPTPSTASCSPAPSAPTSRRATP